MTALRHKPGGPRTIPRLWGAGPTPARNSDNAPDGMGLPVCRGTTKCAWRPRGTSLLSLHIRISDFMLWHMRTSFDIPEPLLRRAKKLARDRKTTLRQVVIDGLRAVVERNTGAVRHRMKDCSFGDGGLVDGLSWSDSERIDELVYGDRT